MAAAPQATIRAPSQTTPSAQGAQVAKLQQQIREKDTILEELQAKLEGTRFLVRQIAATARNQ